MTFRLQYSHSAQRHFKIKPTQHTNPMPSQLHAKSFESNDLTGDNASNDSSTQAQAATTKSPRDSCQRPSRT
ncbi:MAG: hypothetical protein WCL57_01940 [Chloroflexota bacterium]|jgi:hypothetical protein|nr:hypothetical protein [Chloroflexota bacterium]